MFFEYNFGEYYLSKQINQTNEFIEYSYFINNKKRIIPKENAIEIKENKNVGLIQNIFLMKNTKKIIFRVICTNINEDDFGYFYYETVGNLEIRFLELKDIKYIFNVLKKNSKNFLLHKFSIFKV
jgi:hypothetical protein